MKIKKKSSASPKNYKSPFLIKFFINGGAYKIIKNHLNTDGNNILNGLWILFLKEK